MCAFKVPLPLLDQACWLLVLSDVLESRSGCIHTLTTNFFCFRLSWKRRDDFRMAMIPIPLKSMRMVMLRKYSQEIQHVNSRKSLVGEEVKPSLGDPWKGCLRLCMTQANPSQVILTQKTWSFCRVLFNPDFSLWEHWPVVSEVPSFYSFVELLTIKTSPMALTLIWASSVTMGKRPSLTEMWRLELSCTKQGRTEDGSITKLS